MLPGLDKLQTCFLALCGISIFLIFIFVGNVVFLPCSVLFLRGTTGPENPHMLQVTLSYQNVTYLIQPHACSPAGSTPAGIVLLKPHTISKEVILFLRQKWAIPQQSCGYQHVIVLGRITDTSLQNWLESTISDDLLQVDILHNQIPKGNLLSIFRPWIARVCGSSITNVATVENIGLSSFKTVLKLAVVHALQPRQLSAHAALVGFSNCLKNVSAVHEDPYREDGLVVITPELHPHMTGNAFHGERREDVQYIKELLLEPQGRPVGLLNDSFVDRKQTCGVPDDGYFMVILTHSAAGNFDIRQKVRETWGSRETLRRLGAVNRFILGMTSNHSLQKQVAAEASKYADIVEGSFLDSYRNLTRKHATGLRYLSQRCKKLQYRFALKTDDDIVLDLDTIVTYMNRHLSTLPKFPSRTFYCAHLVFREKVPRNPKFKWFITPEQYPGMHYPPYCYGAGYLMTHDLVPALYNMSLYTRPFWVDDVYFRNLRGVKHIQLPNQIPVFTKKSNPEEILSKRRWLVHTYGDSKAFDRFRTAFQTRRNISSRQVFLKNNSLTTKGAGDTLFDIV